VTVASFHAPRSSATTLSDAEAVAAVRAGDRAAFEWVYRRHRPAIHRICRRRLPSPELADDLTQETFVRALALIESFDAEAELRPWLSQIARNLCIDVVSTGARRFEEPRPNAMLALHTGATSPDAFEASIERYRQRRIRQELPRAFAEISERDRAIVWRTVVADEPQDAVGRDYALTVKATRNALWRARTRLRARLTALREEMRTLGAIVAPAPWLRARSRNARTWIANVPGYACDVSVFIGLALAMTIAPQPQTESIEQAATPEAMLRHAAPAPRTEAGRDAVTRSPHRDAGAVAVVRTSFDRDHRDGAVLPRRSALTIRVYDPTSPDGEPLYEERTSMECGDGEGWDRLPRNDYFSATC